MSSQRYQRVAANDDDDDSSRPQNQHHNGIPSSPPPSFHSRASSPSARRLLAEHDPIASDADRTLADTFDSPSDEDSDDDEAHSHDDRQRLMRRSSSDPRDSQNGSDSDSDNDGHDASRPQLSQRVTQLPVFTTTTPASRTRRATPNDGVFANLSAKPTRGEEVDEKPPTYEQAAADATPPYWETTILAPGMVSDEVFVDGLPVGSVFSFAWNAMISMSFQLVGFLLTYLLHTTHAAKNGSRAGLGITLIQFGFAMKGSSSSSPSPQDPPAADAPGSDPYAGAPQDPNAYAFDPNTAAPDAGDAASQVASASGGLTSSDWIAYILMILGWFILIKSVNDFLKARRHEQLVLQSPDRGLPVPIVAEGERPESSV